MRSSMAYVRYGRFLNSLLHHIPHCPWHTWTSLRVKGNRVKQHVWLNLEERAKQVRGANLRTTGTLPCKATEKLYCFFNRCRWKCITQLKYWFLGYTSSRKEGRSEVWLQCGCVRVKLCLDPVNTRRLSLFSRAHCLCILPDVSMVNQSPGHAHCSNTSKLRWRRNFWRIDVCDDISIFYYVMIFRSFLPYQTRLIKATTENGFDIFMFRKYFGAGIFEGLIYVMIFRSFLCDGISIFFAVSNSIN